MVLTRIHHVFLKYSGPNNINSGESKWQALGRDTLWRNFARGQYRIELLLPGKLWDNTAPKFIFASLSGRSVTFAAYHVRDLIYAGQMVDKTKYVFAVLRSISNYIVLQNDHLLMYRLKKTEKKTEKTNLIHGAQNLLLFVVRHWMRARVIMSFAFLIGKTCPKGA